MEEIPTAAEVSFEENECFTVPLWLLRTNNVYKNANTVLEVDTGINFTDKLNTMYIYRYLMKHPMKRIFFWTSGYPQGECISIYTLMDTDRKTPKYPAKPIPRYSEGTVLLGEYIGRVYVFYGSYGSCGGCDVFTDLWDHRLDDDPVDRFSALVNRIHNSVRIFDRLTDIKNVSFDGDFVRKFERIFGVKMDKDPFAKWTKLDNQTVARMGHGDVLK
jgi:hypothetical protein